MALAARTDNQLPRILMAASSILVEWLFRIMTTAPRLDLNSKTVRDRVMVQVLLWLTASMHADTNSNSTSSSNDAFGILLHAIFFVNLCGIVLTLGVYRNGCTRASKNNIPTSRPINTSLITAISISPSLWVALVWVYVQGEAKDSTKQSILVTGGAFVFWNVSSFICKVNYSTILSKRSEQPQPTTVSTAMDESNWHNWTVSDVLQWLEETSGLSQEDLDSILPRLAWERVNGTTLQYLDLEALRYMGIPYGPARRILEHIQLRLLARYPQSLKQQPQEQRHWQTPDSHFTPSMDEENTFLAEFDQEYKLSLAERIQLQQQSHKVWSHHDPAFEEPEAEHVREKLKGLGLPTPDIAKPNESVERQNNEDQHDVQDINAPLAENNMTPNGLEANTVVLEESLLQTMPPHIRDIVQQKPHLWEQVKSMTQAQDQHVESSRATAQPSKDYLSTQAIETKRNQSLQAGELSQHELSSEPQMITPPDILQSLPPHVRDVALRNPQLFQQMLNANQQSQSSPHSNSDTATSGTMPTVPEETYEDEPSEMEQLLSKSHSGRGSLRQRPGY